MLRPRQPADGRFLGLPPIERWLIRNLEELVKGPVQSDLREMRRAALHVFEVALRSVDPGRAVKRSLRRDGDRLRVCELDFDLGEIDSLRLLAFGKASLAMAKAATEVLAPKEALVVVGQGEMAEESSFPAVEGGHPYPDEGSLRAGSLALQMAGRCGPADLFLVLVSGGGSAMLEQTDLPLSVLQEVSELVIRSGMDIKRLNTVRKHLSTVKGGQLARVAASEGGSVISLAISDVVGDSPSFIASGPTAPDETTFSDAKEALVSFGLWDVIPAIVRDRIDAGILGDLPETPKPGNPTFDRVHNVVIANNMRACRAAQEEARRMGFEPLILTCELQGEARDAGRVLAALALSVDEEGLPVGKPAAIIAGGETTVAVKGLGEGGRNQELALAAMPLLGGREIVLLSCGTDGLDGQTNAAGATVDGESLHRSTGLGLNHLEYLRNNDSHGFFRQLGDAVVTGPTGTNVMDLQVILVGPPSVAPR